VQLAVGDDWMIEDLQIWKIVAEHPYKKQLEPGIRDCVHDLVFC
jgi:hypothetical protein